MGRINFIGGAIKAGIGLFMIAACNAAVAGHAISGTYAVKYDRTCIRSPYRLAATPSFFKYSTPDGTGFGFVQAPAGMSYTDVQNQTTRSAESGSYVMAFNPVNNTVTLSSGAYHTVPLTAYVTSPVSVADFGTFTGSGTYASGGSDNYVDLDFQTAGQIGDGVSQIQTLNSKARLETRDKGDNFFSVTGRGVIALQHHLTANLYRDTHCTGFITGTRISKSY
jgi:hypothetical protein